MSSFPPALLALADGTVFRGKGIGAVGVSVGEVVFNTAMSGYQEILTDPGGVDFGQNGMVHGRSDRHEGTLGPNSANKPLYWVSQARAIIQEPAVAPAGAS